MSPIEIRTIPGYKWRMALLAFGGIVLFYFFFGYLPMPFLILGGALVVALLYQAVRGESKEPCIVLNDEGVFDRRLNVGVISWEDIRRIEVHNLEGAHYVSLEVHDLQKYEARRPSWMRLTSKAYRLHGMSSISITTNGLDMDTQTLADIIHEGCETVSQRTVEVD